MKKLNFIIIIAGLVAITFSGFFIGADQPRVEPSTVTATKTVTGELETAYRTFTQHETIAEATRNVTIYRNNTITKTFHNVEVFNITVTATETMTKTQTIPAYENNTVWSINKYLLDRLNTAREMRELEPLVRNRDLANMAEENRLKGWAIQTTQIVTLTKTYTLTRDLDECWRGDLHVAELILTKLADEYGYVIYTSTTHAVGIYVEVDLYKIHVRCVFLGA